VRALTVHQPFASAIIDGPKAVENRSWHGPIGERIAIHAGKSKKSMKDPDVIEMCDELWPEWRDYPHRYGEIIGTVEIEDCCSVSVMGHDPWAFGPVCWRLLDPEACIHPVPVPGKLGLWSVADDIDLTTFQFDECENCGTRIPKGQWCCERCFAAFDGETFHNHMLEDHTP